MSDRAARPVLREHTVGLRRDDRVLDLVNGQPGQYGAGVGQLQSLVEQRLAGDPDLALLQVGRTDLTLSDLERRREATAVRRCEGADDALDCVERVGRSLDCLVHPRLVVLHVGLVLAVVATALGPQPFQPGLALAELLFEYTHCRSPFLRHPSGARCSPRPLRSRATVRASCGG